VFGVKTVSLIVLGVKTVSLIVFGVKTLSLIVFGVKTVSLIVFSVQTPPHHHKLHTQPAPLMPIGNFQPMQLMKQRCSVSFPWLLLDDTSNAILQLLFFGQVHSLISNKLQYSNLDKRYCVIQLG